MRIAIFIYSMSGGGAERVVSYLLVYLQEKGYEVNLILMNSSISYQIPKNIPIYYLEKSKHDESGFSKLIKLPYLAFKYNRLLKSLAISHSFSFLTRPSYINLLTKWYSLKGPKIIISERSHPSSQYGYGDLQSKINRFLIKQLYPKADNLVCNSKGNALDLIQNFGITAKNLKVIHNPIDVEKIQKISPIDESFFDESYFNVITIGRMDEGKNHQLLIRSVESNPKVRLYILGRGYLKKSLEEMVNNRKLTDRVFFLGFDNNPYKYLKKADLFMFGSNHEGFPNVLLEAMSCGLPILSTDCKSGPGEILKLQEPKTNDIMITDYGILTPVKDLKLMRKGLMYFINNSTYLETCRKNVLKRVEDFEKNDILQAYERIFMDQSLVN